MQTTFFSSIYIKNSCSKDLIKYFPGTRIIKQLVLTVIKSWNNFCQHDSLWSLKFTYLKNFSLYTALNLSCYATHPLGNSTSYFNMVTWGNTNQTQNYFGCFALSTPTWNLYLSISMAVVKLGFQTRKAFVKLLALLIGLTSSFQRFSPNTVLDCTCLYYQTKLVALPCLCSFSLILSWFIHSVSQEQFHCRPRSCNEINTHP